MVAVKLNQLSKKYGRRIGISGIDLTINEGEIFGLIGPDGAGKTTILRILMNYILPSDGEAEVFGMDVKDEAKKIKKDTAYVPSEVYFYNKMKAGKFINLTLKAHHQKKNPGKKELINRFELDLRERFDEMDRSDQKKMALAAAILSQPKLLLLDEPLRGLDAMAQSDLFTFLQNLRDAGATVLITGRDSEEIALICDRMAVIENGEITVSPEEFSVEDVDFSEAAEEGVPAEEPATAEETAEPEPPREEDPMLYTAEIMGKPLEEIIAERDAAKAAAEAAAAAAAAADAAALREEIAAQNDEEAEAEEEPAETAEEAAPQSEAAEGEEERAEETASEQEKTESAPDAAKDAEKAAPRPAAAAKPAAAKQTAPNIKMKSVGFDRKAFETIGAKIVSEEEGKIVLEYAGDVSDLAKLLYDLKMNDIRINDETLRGAFEPFYEGGEVQ